MRATLALNGLNTPLQRPSSEQMPTQSQQKIYYGTTSINNDGDCSGVLIVDF